MTSPAPVSKPPFGVDSTNKLSYQSPAYKITEPVVEDGNRLEDIKSKLERYRREREELEKIRSKFASKSQER
jgi:hypothetical protein